MRTLVLLVLLAGCGPKPCPIEARPAGPPLLWRVEGQGGVVWLFGTIHDGGAGEVAPAVWAAVDAAPRVATELGDREPDPDALAEVMRLPRGKGLDQLLPMDAWFDLRDALRGVIREDELRRARPWYAMSLLTRTVSPPPDPTMDEAIVERAGARRVPVDALETWDEQLGALADAVGIPDLVEAIEARKTMRCDLARNRAAYAAGDLAELERVYAAPALALRHRRWLPVLERYLAGGGAFVAVGVGHLVGDGGLPALLEAAGYRVTRVGSGSPGRP